MSRHCLVLLALLSIADSVQAQVIRQQTVQLPTFHYFGVSTTVVVPDRGTIPLGGVTYSSMGRTQFDKVGSSYGRSFDAGGLSVGATIIDHDELDRAVLAEAARKRGAHFDVMGRPITREALQGEPVLDRKPLSPLGKSIDGDVYLRRGQEAEASGQPEIAKVFYRRAATLGNMITKRTAEERLVELIHKTSR